MVGDSCLQGLTSYEPASSEKCSREPRAFFFPLGREGLTGVSSFSMRTKRRLAVRLHRAQDIGRDFYVPILLEHHARNLIKRNTKPQEGRRHLIRRFSSWTRIKLVKYAVTHNGSVVLQLSQYYCQKEQLFELCLIELTRTIKKRLYKLYILHGAKKKKKHTDNSARTGINITKIRKTIAFEVISFLQSSTHAGFRIPNVARTF